MQVRLNVLKDRTVVLRDVEASLTESDDIRGFKRWDGRFHLSLKQWLVIDERYVIELEDGRSAEILLSTIQMALPGPLVTFRVGEWLTSS